MTKYIALLRGINVSGQKKIKMAELRKMLEKSGLINVETYIQSGNILFDSDMQRQNLITHISKLIYDNYGYEVITIIRNPDELRSIIEQCPFLKDPDKENKKIYYTLLDEPPLREHMDTLSSIDYSPEEYEIVGTTIHFYSAIGYGKAKLNNNLFEKKLKVHATSRNLRTIQTLVELSG